MKQAHKYILEKGSRKHRCPDCHRKTFVRYIDTHTSDYLPEQYGRCDREIKCGCFNPPPPPEPQPIKCLFVPFCKLEDYSPKAYKLTQENKLSFIPKSIMFEVVENGCYVPEWYLQHTNNPPTFLNNDCRYYENGQRSEPPKPLPKCFKIFQNTTPEPAFIPKAILQQTLQGYEQNVFIQNLLHRVPYPFDAIDIDKVSALYRLGTICNGYRAGAITFPFIDKEGYVRAIQVKQFDTANHTTGTDFLHAIIEKYHQKRNEPLPGWLQAYNQTEKKVSCLFGESLLNEFPLNPVALVEAPKSAIYGTLYFGFPAQPDNLLWLAVYNVSSLHIDKCKALQNRDVYLFPDLSKEGTTFQRWSKKAKELTEQMPGTRFEVSDLLETLASKELKEKGADIADVLIQLDWRKFRNVLVSKKQRNHNSFHTVPVAIVPENEKHEKYEDYKNNFLSSEKLVPTPNEPETTVKLMIEGKQLPPPKNLIKPETEEWHFLGLFGTSGKVEPSEQIKHSNKHISAEWRDLEINGESSKVTGEQDLTALETFFNHTLLPTYAVKLNSFTTITDVPFFINSHLTIVKANARKRTAQPYLNRLIELKKVLTTKCYQYDNEQSGSACKHASNRK